MWAKPRKSIISSSEKDTSPKPMRLPRSVVGQRATGAFWSLIFELNHWEKRERKKEISCSSVCFILHPALKYSCCWYRAAELCVDKLLLIVCGHSFLKPLVTKTRTIVPHITVLVKIELNQYVIPGVQVRSLYLLGRLVFWLCFAFKRYRQI